MDDWITDQMLAWAKNPDNIANFRDDCRDIFNDHVIENKAKVIIRSWSATATVKEIIDNWIIENDAIIVRRGASYFLENKDRSFSRNMGKAKNFAVEYAMMARRRYEQELINFSHDGQTW